MLGQVYLITIISINSLCIYGGGSRKQQIQAVEKGVEIVIGMCMLLSGFLSIKLALLLAFTL